MDTDQLIQHSRARFDHATARRVLKEKYEAKLIFAHNGGMWCAGPGLITFLTGRTEIDLVMLDLYDNPVRVQVPQLRREAEQRWKEQMNAWLVEYESLNQKR